MREKKDSAFISLEKDVLLHKGKLKRYDIVLTTRGTVGNLAYYDASVPYNYIRINSGMVLLRNESSFLDTDFLYLLLRSHLVQTQIERLVFGSAQPQLTVKGISEFQIVAPPLPEQRAIAEALADVDGLLGALEALIAKHRAIKQAAMQQLLSGKTRLPEFQTKLGFKQTEVGVIPKDWEVTRIDAHAFIKTGSKNTQDKQEDGEYPFFVRSQEVERINSYSYDGEAVLTAGDGVGTGKVFHYIVGRFDVHQRVYRIADFSDQLNSRYFFYQFSTRFYDRIMSMTAKSSVDSVRMETIAGMKIQLPPLPEQTAIAAVLSDMDAAIEALARRRDKTRAIKQGMMQQLLTGRVRLIRLDSVARKRVDP